MKLKPKSYLLKSEEPMDSLKRRHYLDGSKEMDLLYRARSSWDALSVLRAKRERLMRFTYGEQYLDRIEVDGVQMSEGSYWETQGVTPKKNNMIRKMVRSVIGVYKNQGMDYSAVAIDKEEQTVAEMMTVTLQANRELNRMEELELRLIEEFLISGMAYSRESWGWRKGRKDTWTDIVNPNYIFFDGVMQDPRHWDCDIIGQLHDMRLPDLLSKFATSEADYRAISDVYKNARDINFMSSYYEQIYSHGRDGAADFFIPADISMCRVIEVWNKEQKPRYRCHDVMKAEYYVIEEDEIAVIEEENKKRLEQGVAQGMPKAEIPFIEVEWFIDTYWYYRFLTPLGDVLQEGETPFNHGEHPFTLKIYPFIDGKPHSLVEDAVDQQKFINELITLYMLMAKHSAKGLLMFPEQSLGDMAPEDIANEYAKVNGMIVYEAKAGVPLPQQLSANVSNFNISELLKIEMGMFEEVTGVYGALQGKTPGSGTAASLYAQQAQNASNTLVDILTSFSNFMKEAMYKKMMNIDQYYTDERIINVAGARYGGIKKWEPTLTNDVTFDIMVSEGMSSPQYKQVMNATYLDMFKMQVIDREQLLKFGDFPNGEALLQDIQLKMQQMNEQQEQQGVV